MTEMAGWGWRQKIDPMKMLPTLDERAQALTAEFARQLLEHVNPCTGLRDADDPQVLTFEIVNESSAEYCLICGNKVPDYFEQKRQKKWQAFAFAAGLDAPEDFRTLGDPAAKQVRAAFLWSLDADHFAHMRGVIRATGSQAAITYSNLWRGHNALAMHAEMADHIEDHAYVDPFAVRDATDLFAAKSRTVLADKPYFIGELNQAEGQENIRNQSPFRTMLPLAASTYGAFQNDTGLVWFAWNHGDRALAPDGYSNAEDRSSHLGDMISDAMMQDHLRTCGMIFRRGNRPSRPTAPPLRQ